MQLETIIKSVEMNNVGYCAQLMSTSARPIYVKNEGEDMAEWLYYIDYPNHNVEGVTAVTRRFKGYGSGVSFDSGGLVYKFSYRIANSSDIFALYELPVGGSV